MNAVGRSKTADSAPGRWAKRVIERRRGTTRSSHSETKRKEFCGGERERMAECLDEGELDENDGIEDD